MKTPSLFPFHISSLFTHLVKKRDYSVPTAVSSQEARMSLCPDDGPIENSMNFVGILYNVVRPDAQPRKFPLSDLYFLPKTSPMFYMPVRFAKSQCEQMVGKPVYDSHQYSDHIGCIAGAWVSQDPKFTPHRGHYSICVRVKNDKKKYQSLLRRRKNINTAEDFRMSIGMTYEICIDEEDIVYEESDDFENGKFPDWTKTLCYVCSWRVEEASVCDMGALPGCRVTATYSQDASPSSPVSYSADEWGDPRGSKRSAILDRAKRQFAMRSSRDRRTSRLFSITIMYSATLEKTNPCSMSEESPIEVGPQDGSLSKDTPVDDDGDTEMADSGGEESSELSKEPVVEGETQPQSGDLSSAPPPSDDSQMTDQPPVDSDEEENIYRVFAKRTFGPRGPSEEDLRMLGEIHLREIALMKHQYESAQKEKAEGTYVKLVEFSQGSDNTQAKKQFVDWYTDRQNHEFCDLFEGLLSHSESQRTECDRLKTKLAKRKKKTAPPPPPAEDEQLQKTSNEPNTANAGSEEPIETQKPGPPNRSKLLNALRNRVSMGRDPAKLQKAQNTKQVQARRQALRESLRSKTGGRPPGVPMTVTHHYSQDGGGGTSRMDQLSRGREHIMKLHTRGRSRAYQDMLGRSEQILKQAQKKTEMVNMREFSFSMQ